MIGIGISANTWLLLAVISSAVYGHRMCLNYQSPVRMVETFSLCRDFETFGCCNKQDDDTINKRYLSVMGNLTVEQKANCSEVIKELLCQACSEYSAHQYDFEKTGKSMSLPGLCDDYCDDIFKRCSDAITHITNDETLLSSIRNNDKDGFCEALKLPDRYYCYPFKDEYSSGYVQQFFQIPKEKPCSQLCVEEVANHVYSPTSIKHARDGSQRLFISEQMGIVWIYLRNKDRIHPPFLNVTERVTCDLNGYDERGFLDVEFHPNFKANGLFYVYYNIADKEEQDFTRISEMKVSDNDMNTANVSYERVLLEISQPYRNHNGGQLLFGPDGYLYIFVGDGGAGGDPHNHAQNKSSLLGKILRVDPGIATDGQSYGIPDDNPYISDPTARPEVYAYGLRNPWKCSFGVGGRLYCGDVGQSTEEEINIIVKGGNYGWRALEGHRCYDESMCHNVSITENHIPPIHSYNTSFGRSVTGGYQYRGCENSKLRGFYIYGDFMSGRIAMLRQNKQGRWIPRNVCMSKKLCTRFGKQYKYPRYIQTFGEDESGELYFGAAIEPRPGSRSGRIYKLSQAYPTTCLSECNRYIERPTVLSSEARFERYNPLPEGEIEIRLEGSGQTRIQTKGRVRIRPRRGRWSTICGRFFTINDGHVICRMMGFLRAREVSVGEFGPGRGRIRFENLRCSGTEDHINECDHDGWQEVESCDHGSDACVWCETFTFT